MDTRSVLIACQGHVDRSGRQRRCGHKLKAAWWWRGYLGRKNIRTWCPECERYRWFRLVEE